MAVAVFSFILFTAGWLIHLALWRVHVPRPATRMLLVIFFSILPVGLAAAWWLPGLQLGRWQLVQASLFHIAAALAYIIIYAGIEEPSPTLTLVRKLHGAGASGCPLDELSAVLTDDALVDVRLHSLQASGLAVHKSGEWRLTPEAVRVARVMETVSTRILNLPKGG